MHLRVQSGLAALVLPLCLTWLSGCNQSPATSASEKAAATGAQAREARLVRIEPVVQREMVRVLETTTVVESEREVRLFFRTSGIAVDVLAEEGDRVAAGDVLARLDRREMELAVGDAEVALEEAKQSRDRLEVAIPEFQLRIENSDKATGLARSEFERAQRLSASGESAASLISEQELERTKNALDNALHNHEQLQLNLRRSELDLAAAETAIRRAEGALLTARLNLDHTELTAPISGVVATRSLKVGDLVTNGEPAYVLTDPENLRAVFWRPQRELALFTRAGTGAAPAGDAEELSITAASEAIPGWTFDGRIVRTSPTIDPNSGSFRVTARFAPTVEGEGDPVLLPGMLVRVRIVTDRHPDALVVHKRAIRREGDELFLFKVEDGIAYRVDVVEGYSENELVEVTPRGTEARLAPGTQVIVVGNRDLEDGAEVEIDEPVPAATDAPEEPSPAAETPQAAAAETAAGADE